MTIEMELGADQAVSLLKAMAKPASIDHLVLFGRWRIISR